ncbi:type II secretion system F family protein [Roseiconus lacunae]|uniref:type II secretion system F family protein n=1 Tax=Roseiconus lacunae TaxID=2605694 RepID=UPI001E3F350F|nr:type II secretion system F family protein [Roseiconus lacunae]MCD0461730.1 type II secretion system F family protein [Roseiconus lacunae]
MAQSTTLSAHNGASLASVFKSLHEIKFGADPSRRFKSKDLVLLMRNLTTLVSNGVSLAHAIETVSKDRSMAKYHTILRSLSRHLQSGESLSSAMNQYPEAFSEILVSQISVGEMSGHLDKTLSRITEQLEQSSSQKAYILKKLTYPALLLVAGIGSVAFMLTNVIPTFQKMYDDAGATLPWVTQFLIDLSQFLTGNGMVIVALLSTVSAGIYSAFRHPKTRRSIDECFVKLPLIGDWFRKFAVLQFSEVLGNLMESGFTVAEALPSSARAVSNQYVREKIQSLHSAVRRGERFSVAIEREGDLFPEVVKQLVIVGERTGRLAPVTRQIRKHLRQDVQTTTDAIVAAIEPVLTMGLAVVVGGILLAVYLPMFDLIGKVGG